jgi:hypothetical protein
MLPANFGPLAPKEETANLALAANLKSTGAQVASCAGLSKPDAGAQTAHRPSGGMIQAFP